jgi:hypothetical protein
MYIVASTYFLAFWVNNLQAGPSPHRLSRSVFLLCFEKLPLYKLTCFYVGLLLTGLVCQHLRQRLRLKVFIIYSYFWISIKLNSRCYAAVTLISVELPLNVHELEPLSSCWCVMEDYLAMHSTVGKRFCSMVWVWHHQISLDKDNAIFQGTLL